MLTYADVCIRQVRALMAGQRAPASHSQGEGAGAEVELLETMLAGTALIEP